jgi:predicted DNA-binding transcriptional regulator YafY
LDSGIGAPTSRLLELLELLQAKPLVTGRELGDRLGVDRRTVRRDLATLQRLGIPVEGERGVGGGYRLRPGYRLPPLMLTEDEATAVVLGLTAARRLALGDADGTDGALSKIHRVLPETLRRRVEALEATLAFTGPAITGEPPAGETVLLLAEAIRRGRRVGATYRSFEGDETKRELSPYGLVVHAGRWYLAAYDDTRSALRTFRVDRIRGAAMRDALAHPAPTGFDALEHVSRSLAQVPWPWELDVLLELPLDDARRRVPGTLAELSEENGGTALRMRVSSLDWAASLLAGLGCPFRVRGPDELRTSVAALSERLAGWASA